MKERKSLRELASEADGDDGTIRCPRCGCRDFYASKTEQGSSSTFRWKNCRHCGHGVVTRTETTEKIVRDVKRRKSDEDADDGLVLRLA